MLFTEINVGETTLHNRIAMAPMTRSRTDQPGNIPNQMMAEYYAQRASAGLLITEGAPISPVARGYSMTPGIYTPEHIKGWKKVTEAVHAKGGKIFVQLWHVGRRSNKAVADITPVSASAVKEADMVFGPLPSGGFGMVETSTPLAMTKEDIQSTVEDFMQAAKNAMEAGFDGVELHGAHGYLLEQFLYKASNLRTDEYGGSQENRMRFPLEVVEAVVDTIGAQHVAIRLSPFVTEGFNQEDPEIKELTLKLIEALDPYGLAYLHISENISKHTEMTDSYREDIRKVYTHPIMVAGQYNKEKALNVINNGYADLVAIGQPFITNPDYVYRIQNNLALNPVDDIAKSTFYGGDEKGYLDYPVAENV